MNRLDQLLKYSRDKVQATQVPPNLYSRAERRMAAIDSVLTAIIALALIGLSSLQFSSKASIQPPVAREYIEHDLVATEVAQ
ncbi:MAG: hypothetical protein JST12_12160 [Armatimonadetes bacterium]|nr:hypothetical protein [Armatimonadota bacterium]